ncbi:MAG: helix-turn-helix domain-containing protein [Prevotellaceae bacterium]|jgi:transcriptional regulator with XRE-family HTH domain|nr:helix-turn-helix domain-containing protein [Prevotellaceae bacterium]
MKNIHIGNIIKQKLAESSMTVTDFADKINCDRTTVYDIFKRKSLDVERLIKISQALNFDFINEIYLKQPSKIYSNTDDKIFIAVEIDTNILRESDLPDSFVQLIKRNK